MFCTVMDNFICENSIIIQHIEKLGLKAWIIPVVLLIISGFYFLQTERKVVLKKTEYDSGFAYRRRWRPALLCILAFILLGYLNFENKNEKIAALENGQYHVYAGTLTDIDANRFFYIVPVSVRLTVRGSLRNEDGSPFQLSEKWSHIKIEQKNARTITTQNGLYALGGKTCLGRKCGLSIGDNVRVRTYGFGDTISIEKCQN